MAQEAFLDSQRQVGDDPDIPRDSAIRTVVRKVLSDSKPTIKPPTSLRDSVMDLAKHFGRSSASLGDILNHTYKPRPSLYQSFDATHIAALKKHYFQLSKHLRLQGIAESPQITQAFNTLPTSIDSIEKWNNLLEAFVTWLTTHLSLKTHNQDILLRIDYILQQLADLNPSVERVLIPLKEEPVEYIPAGRVLELLKSLVGLIDSIPTSPVPQISIYTGNKEMIAHEIRSTIKNIQQHTILLYECLSKQMPKEIGQIIEILKATPSLLTSAQIDSIYNTIANDAKIGIDQIWNGEDLIISDYTTLESVEFHIETIMREIIQLKAFARTITLNT